MTSQPAAPPGAQRPRLRWSPPRVSSSAGQEAVELATAAGLDLDPWQRLVLEESLGERADGKWAAFEVGLVVARQNGKGAILEARELAGLFLFGERLILHSAHQFDTALEAFRRILQLIESTPDLDSRVRRVSRAHGEEGIELRSGQRLRFKARTVAGGRGFSGDTVILDEAMILPPAVMGALMPTMSARPNPQLWYVGSAVDQDVHEHGLTLAKVRERGVRGGDPGLCWLEWSADAGRYTDRGGVDYSTLNGDVAAWAAANPGLGIRIAAEHVDRERRSMSGRTFAVERLGVGDWPAERTSERVIDPQAWAARADRASTVGAGQPVAFAVDVAPDRRSACVVAAGLRDDGVPHVEVVCAWPGTDWVVDTLSLLVERWDPCAVALHSTGPAGSLIPALESVGIEPVGVGGRELVQACGAFFDAAAGEGLGLRHLGDPILDDAVASASKRGPREAWAWDRKDGQDVPLVAATVAMRALAVFGRPARVVPAPVSVAAPGELVAGSETSSLVGAGF